MSLDIYSEHVRILRNVRGFTLVEVLVSLGIVSVALLAGIRATDNLVSNSQRLTDVLLGQICAENQLIKVRLSKSMPDVGSSAFSCEQGGRLFPGTMIVTATPNPSFRRVDSLIKDGDSVLIKLSTVVGRF
ncbi:MAG TPA: type II secretion system minor pseudopilin GspI [Burkholderiaceae bacterium]|nr:type II secretion system minor pseudopilin GspI [Burkholderiaceae bacterium]